MYGILKTESPLPDIVIFQLTHYTLYTNNCYSFENEL